MGQQAEIQWVFSSQSIDSLLKNSDFKQQFGRFLQQKWQKGGYREFSGGKKLYVSHGGLCMSIEDSNNTISCPEMYQGNIFIKLFSLVLRQIYGSIFRGMNGRQTPIFFFFSTRGSVPLSLVIRWRWLRRWAGLTRTERTEVLSGSPPRLLGFSHRSLAPRGKGMEDK